MLNPRYVCTYAGVFMTCWRFAEIASDHPHVLCTRPRSSKAAPLGHSRAQSMLHRVAVLLRGNYSLSYAPGSSKRSTYTGVAMSSPGSVKLPLLHISSLVQAEASSHTVQRQEQQSSDAALHQLQVTERLTGLLPWSQPQQRLEGSGPGLP